MRSAATSGVNSVSGLLDSRATGAVPSLCPEILQLSLVEVPAIQAANWKMPDAGSCTLAECHPGVTRYSMKLGPVLSDHNCQRLQSHGLLWWRNLMPVGIASRCTGQQGPAAQARVREGWSGFELE